MSVNGWGAAAGLIPARLIPKVLQVPSKFSCRTRSSELHSSDWLRFSHVPNYRS